MSAEAIPTSTGASATAVTTGSVSLHTRGFGFLELDDAAGTAFVAPPELNLFLAGDRVRAGKITAAADGRLTASALTLVERRRSELFGTVVRRSGRTWLKVDRTVANTDWRLEAPPATLAELADGAFVLARIGEGTSATFERAVPATDVGLERVRVRHGLRSSYPPIDPVGPDGAAAEWRPSRAVRRDLTDVPTVTIDGPSSRDLDDAVAVLPAGKDGALRVLVSIADVDALVERGSPIDEEARARGTSVYLAGQVLNMLPPALSEDRLSLLEGVERPTLTVEMRIDPDGVVTAVDLYPSITRTIARLTYEDVAGYLDRGDVGTLPVAVLPTLRWLRTAGARLGAMRAARGGVEILREDAYITMDDATGEPTAVGQRHDGSANVLIERLMVAANEAVARWLHERGLPGMYRVHDEPSADAVQLLVESARHFGFELGLDDRLSPRSLAALYGQIEGTSVAPAMMTVLSRALGPARYTVHPSLHFGLAAPLYLHFTSPIRRYADLVVHRVVKRYLAGARDMQAHDERVEALAKHLNDCAWRATKAENERQYMLAARLFASKVGERFGGNVIAVKPFGLVVQLAGQGVSGTIQTDLLPDGPYSLDTVNCLVGAKRRFAVGDALLVVVVGTSEELGRIDLGLAEAEPSA
ncbi:MAG: RNB domain-containing ribonuclease [Myxococcota bacterium]